MYKIKIALLLLSVLTALNVFSQGQYNNISKENADCIHAIVLEDTIYGPSNAPKGYGNIMEITADKANKYYFEKEHNTVWYKFTVPQTCILTFEIIPEDIKNDYDFILFKYTDSNFCIDVKTKKIIPVRSNISRNAVGINSITGLSKDSNATYVHSGPGRQFSNALNVTEGEVLYLVVDNVSNNGKGHTLKLHYNDCEVPQDIYSGTLNVSITDKDTDEPVNAFADIFLSNAKFSKNPEFHFDSVSTCKMVLDNRQTYFLQIASRGYLNYTKEIVFPKGQSKINEIVKLEKIDVGKNFMIENIYFFGNLNKFLPSSTPALQHLLRFMNMNLNVNIEIQGHVNWPIAYGKSTKSQDEFNWQLSEDRAKAVYDYLVKNRISADRLTYNGYGSTKMLFPEAVSPHENQQNRRVEIYVTSY